MIREKNRVLNAAAFGGAVVPLPTAGPGQSHTGGPGKFEFYCSKGLKLASYLFIFK